MSGSKSHIPFYEPFFWASSFLSLLGGFGLAGHLSFVVGYGYPAGLNFIILMQAHGHVQLFGWAGLLLLGVSLYVLPRLMSRPVRYPAVIPCIFLFATAGVLLRFIPLFMVTLPQADRYSASLSPYFLRSIEVGVILQMAALCLYLVTIVTLMQSGIVKREIRRLAPFFIPMLFGWIVYVSGNLFLVFNASGSDTFLLEGYWNSFLIEVFVRMTLVSAILGFGVKMLPVFLGLKAPLWPVGTIGVIYSASTLIYLMGDLLGFELVSSAGLLGMSVALIWFVWELDALLFRENPERVTLKTFRTDALTHRGRFGDRGEYGRFELFIVSGFGWALFLALAEAINSIFIISGFNAVFPPAVLRHVLLLGFISHIIFGVAFRLLPGLMGRRLLSTRLVSVTFLFLTAATFGRLLPELLGVFGLVLAPGIYGWSGTLAMIALILFMTNFMPLKGLKTKEKKRKLSISLS